MCGIAGFLVPSGRRGRAELSEIARGMADAVRHRGPDDQGYWLDVDAGIGLAHRRLSILDLSPAGGQPMVSSSGRWVITFNGEIYNHLDIRRDLERSGRASVWRGHSDTETLVESIAASGLAETLLKCEGMFAFAAWDRETRSLSLVRDRLGEKPLFYGVTRRSFIFGSELRALAAHPDFDDRIDLDSVALLLRHGFVPCPRCIFSSYRKLPPGHMLTVAPGDSSLPAPVPYWRLSAAMRRMHPSSCSENEAIRRVDRELKEVVAGQLLADVPLGAFLSGGIDSTAVVAVAQAVSSRPLKTFTVGFEEPAFDEIPYARDVAHYLGSEHYELRVTARDALSVVHRLGTIYDEPFADPSQIPTFLVCDFAKRHVSVALSGDGGDEVFCGYRRYQLTASCWKWISLCPRDIRRAISGAVAGVPLGSTEACCQVLSALVPPNTRSSFQADRILKAAAALQADSVADLYFRLTSLWSDPGRVLVTGSEPGFVREDCNRLFRTNNMIDAMMAMDTAYYLPDDILVKVDRAAMAVGLETRVPFLSHRIVELAWQLPNGVLLRNGDTKWVLRQVLRQYLPQQLIDRPKMGFGVPLAAWLRGPLREWSEELLAEDRLRREGIFVPGAIRRKWDEHLSGRRSWHYQLWSVLMFQAWLQAFRFRG